MISLPNYGELSNWWRSHERKLLHERVIGCTNHLGECDINFHWAETLAVMSPFVAVPLATMSRVITFPFTFYRISRRENWPPLTNGRQRSEIAANLLDSLPPAAGGAEGDVEDICGIFSLYYQIFTGNLKNYHG